MAATVAQAAEKASQLTTAQAMVRFGEGFGVNTPDNQCSSSGILRRHNAVPAVCAGAAANGRVGVRAAAAPPRARKLSTQPPLPRRRNPLVLVNLTVLFDIVELNDFYRFSDKDSQLIF